MYRLFLLPSVAFLVLLSLANTTKAQIQVDFSVKRPLYIAYEPILATVSLSNRSGRDITLEDTYGKPWFSFQIITKDNRLIAPHVADYKLAPLILRSGETVRRVVNLVDLYPLTDFGSYRIHANIYSAELQRYFSSKHQIVEITDGNVVWQEVLGVPAGEKNAGEMHTVYLLTHQRKSLQRMYVRIIAEQRGRVLCTYPLGRIISSIKPDIEFDNRNQLHVLQQVDARSFLLSKIGINGEWLGQTTYTGSRTRPHLRKNADGIVQVAGGELQVPVDPNQPSSKVPKLSDRPVNLPNF